MGTPPTPELRGREGPAGIDYRRFSRESTSSSPDSGALFSGCWLLRSLHTSLSVLGLGAPPRPPLRSRRVSAYLPLLRTRVVSAGLGGTGWRLEPLCGVVLGSQLPSGDLPCDRPEQPFITATPVFRKTEFGQGRSWNVARVREGMRSRGRPGGLSPVSAHGSRPDGRDDGRAEQTSNTREDCIFQPGKLRLKAFSQPARWPLS